MKALRRLMYSSLCFWPLAHLQSENKKVSYEICQKRASFQFTGDGLLVPRRDKVRLTSS